MLKDKVGNTQILHITTQRVRLFDKLNLLLSFLCSLSHDLVAELTVMLITYWSRCYC